MGRAHRAAHAVPGQRGRRRARPATRTSSSCTACRPSTTARPRSGEEIFQKYGHGRPRGHRRGLRVASTRSSSTRPRTGCTRSRPSWSPRSGTEADAMRVVVALGGNALLKRGRADDRRGPARQRPGRRAGAGRRRRASTSSCSRTATARRSACWRSRRRRTRTSRPYPLDVLGAQTEGMIGYVLEQELGNAAAARRAVRHHPDDGRGRRRRPGLRRPDQVRRSDLRPRPRPTRWPPTKGWVFKADGDSWRRVVPSPAAEAHLRDPADPLAARARTSSSSAPAAAASRRCSRRRPDRTLVGVEAVIDKDLASELLAREVDADLFVMATDVDGGVRRLGHARAAAARAG